MTRPANYPSEPKNLWDRFYELTQVPRPSKREEKAIDYLVNFAKTKNLKWKSDSFGNVVIYVPATKGYEKHGAVIIQNHIDMVCDKTPDREFDFDNDPINLLVENGWITADRTTLGADNGFGCAAALAIVDEKDAQHPPLELLFTLDEETGLHGANNLDASLLSGKRMMNLDTEDWGSIYIGCAGGKDYELEKKYELQEVFGDVFTYQIGVSGFKGGHSGLDIHKGRANAIKVLAEFLYECQDLDFELAEFSGGKAHNIVPRDAVALINLSEETANEFSARFFSYMDEMKRYLLPEDREFQLLFEKTEFLDETIGKAGTKDFLNFMMLYPHGPRTFNWSSKDPLVNFSSNLAIVRLEDGELYTQTSLRHFDLAERQSLDRAVEALASTFHCELKGGVGYPSWKPIFEGNKLLDGVKDLYREYFKKEVEVKAIHAGLECGIIKEKLGNIDIISFGPNITGAHSPSERIEIESSNRFWEFYKKVLESL